jgi:HEAT repeat protein
MLRPLAWIHLALLLLSLSGCKGDPKEPAYWDKQLSSARRIKDKERILSELRDSGNLKAPFLPMLHAHLVSEKQPEVKAAIARLLREAADPTSVGPLSDAIDFGNADSAGNAMNKEIASALGKIADPKSVPTLVRLLSSRDQYVRIEAINALGSMRAKDAVQPLIAIATDDSGEPFVSKKAIQSLGEIGDPTAVPSLIRMMFKERRGVTYYAESSFALFQIGRPAGDALLRVLDGEDKSLMAWARQNNVIEPAIYAKTAQVLGDLLDRRAEKALLSHLSFDSEYVDLKLFVRMRMADALGRLRCKDAIKPLVTMIVQEEEPTAREEYVRALARIGTREAVPTLLKLASKGSWDQRESLIEAIAMLGGEEEAQALAKLASSEESLTAAECKASPKAEGCQHPSELAKKHLTAIQRYQKLLQAGQQCSSDGACWAKRLQDQDERIRERAAYELGRSVKAEMVDPLIGHLAEANLDVRLAVIQSLDWLIVDARDAAKKASGSIEKIEQQLTEERGRTEFVKVNEDLRRLAVQLRRQRA